MDLSGHNSFRMKVSCRNFLEYDCAADLEKLDFEAMEGGVKHIGGGSNLLYIPDLRLPHRRGRVCDEPV